MTESEQRTWGMLAHLAALSGFIIPFGNILGPLIVWLIKKEESSFVNDQGKESLNFQITLCIYVIGAIILALIFLALTFIIPFLGILTVLIYLLIFAIAIAEIVFVIIAAVKSNKGEYYRYPLTIRFLK